LYNINRISHQPDEPHWQDYRHFNAVQLSRATRAWLLDQGSLTQRLIKASHGNFNVQVLSQSWQRPLLSERALLEMKPRELAIVREVLLLCNDEPWVFARSVMPASSLNGRLRRLRKFDNSSLGAMLFSEPSMQRHPFQLATFDGENNRLPSAIRQAELLWGRRSRFELTGKPIMVSEIFLPAFKP
jgi:chorismate--pyruvate lyase